MSKKSYSEKLRDPRWQKKRLEIFQRDQFSCRCCGGNTTTLHIHHLSYQGEPWEVPDIELLTICEQCHWIVSEFKYDIKNILVLPFLIAYKVELEDGSFVVFFQQENEIAIIKFHSGNPIPIAILPDSTMREVIQSIVNNWQFGNKPLIDQSPI